MSVTADIRELVRAAYDHCCGYCGVQEKDVGGLLEIDHYRPVATGGDDDLANLVYACVHCNRFKGSYWPDADAPESFHLLHPAEDEIEAHIQLSNNGRFVGLTPRGWFHIRWLHLNRPQLILWRQNQWRIRQLEEALQQAETTAHHLQKRIRDLERESAELRAQLARLSKLS
jgi:hypothetical protein